MNPPDSATRRFDAVLFDLDGTLLDTLADIGAAANAVLEQAGHPPHPLDAYRRFIGSGVQTLFARALPETARTDATIEACAAGFQTAYAARWNVATRLYAGIAELLDALTAHGARMAVLSNKPDGFTRQCVEHYLAAWDFEVVFGERPGIPRKPDPTSALEIVRIMGIAPERFLYLGDTAIDIQTARAAGMYPVGVAWGFRPVEELQAAGAARIVEAPTEVVDLIRANTPE
jgi:phosphoglycolate phosphatase